MKKSRFCAFLITHNHLRKAGFKRWAFQTGMLFHDLEAWWGDKGSRPRPHEGVDFCCYEQLDGCRVNLSVGSRIPAMYDGEIVHILDDFLGQSILVAHDALENGPALHSIYAHVAPLDGLTVGEKVRAGDIIATIVPVKTGKIIAHLHLSLLLPAKNFDLKKMDWDMINDPEAVTLLDPFAYMQRGLRCGLPQKPENAWHVYMVRCQDGALYTGIAKDLQGRVAAHNGLAKNGAKYTRSRRPVRLVYAEPAESRAAAARREYQLKKMDLTQKNELIAAGPATAAGAK